MRIKANTLGLTAEDYETDKVDVDELYTGDALYTGIGEMLVSAEQMSAFFQAGGTALAAMASTGSESELESEPGPEATSEVDGSSFKGKFFPNQALTLVDVNNPTHTTLATLRPDGQVIPMSQMPYSGVSRIQVRNREQRFVFALLLNDAIPLVTLVGKAGTGKTLLAIAAGLQKVSEEKHYTRLLISHPVVSMGQRHWLFAR